MEISSSVDKLKIKIRSVLLSSKQGVKKSDFLREYTQLTSEVINVKQLGYKTLSDFMASIPDTVVSRGDSYSAVSTESTEHLEKLIQRQKPTFNKSRETGYPKKNDSRYPPSVRKYGRSIGPHVHKKTIAPGRQYKKHVSSSGPPIHGQYLYNANNKFKQPPKMPMGVSRLSGKKTPPVNMTTASLHNVKMKVLSILCQAADGLHVSVLEKKFRSQTGTNIPFVEYGYNSIGDLMSGFMWNNFKCIHSGDFYFAVRSSSGASNNNNNNNVGIRQPARNSNLPMWGSSNSNITAPSAHFNNKHRPLLSISSDNKRNMLQSPETNGIMQNRRYLHPKGPPTNRNIHRNKKQTANNRGKKAMSSFDDDYNQEEFINNQQQNFNDRSYGELDSSTTTSSSHHQGPPHHRLSRSDITRSELPSDASSNSDYSATASGSFTKNLKTEANNPRNRSYSTNSNNSGGVGSNGSQPLEDFDYDSPWDEQVLSFPSSEEPQIFKNTFDPISSGLRFKKGRGCGRGYGLSSYMGERLPGGPRFSERSVALPENWNSSEKLSFQHGSVPLENLIISIRNTTISDKPTSPGMGCGLGRGRGRTRKT